MARHVILYSTQSCQYCWEVREFLRQQQIPFVEVGVDISEDAAREVKKLTGDIVVPVTLVKHDHKEELVIGFNRQKLAQILEI